MSDKIAEAAEKTVIVRFCFIGLGLFSQSCLQIIFKNRSCSARIRLLTKRFF
ncbi:hypothetical protein GcM1_201048 [Golovinomyces cichoracearum]|uniref:Uncharacterized protein n=1 Tax=Golovinomyces cichoracearum TaxID=62708 RepID=A0A420IYK7_9PEZI|nr:hypothetical protein GcM1_201048 [Golovinomyces cichoracearum]